ncbi:MAG: glycine cleavage T C-terminal barrel domain-containing protein, partial [Candidatus Hydrogenedentota bacterium]
VLETTGIQLLFNGPESFTPDDRYWLGESPEVKRLFVAAGFNSVGIQSSGGVGKVLAQWIVNGQAPMNLWDVDINRMQPHQNNSNYLRDRTVESLGLLYAMHWPFRQFETARNVRKSGLHDRLAAAGACFGEVAGWERANWYAPAGVQARYEYSYGRPNWFEHSAAEHRAVREEVGLLDQSSFTKILVQGRDAESVLNRICTNDIAVPVGKCVYTQWLNDRGTIEADLTVTRIAEDEFFVITGPATNTQVLNWLRHHISADAYAQVTDVTSGWATLNVQGPRSREMLSSMTRSDLSNDAFPFGTTQEIELGYAMVKALRISYVGELGWELYIPSEFVQSVYDLIVSVGVDFGLRHVGYHALNSLRIEKAYREFGHDIGADDTPLEAGLGFAQAFDKPGGFIGREALLLQKERGLNRRLLQFLLGDPEPLMYHNEPIYRDNEFVGYTASAMYGHTLGGSVAMGYVTNNEDLLRADYQIEVAGRRYPAQASLRPLYDPRSARIRG